MRARRSGKASRGTARRGSRRAGRRDPRQRTSLVTDGRPLVAIVGRPNVGKSALFNRLTHSRLAIVEDVQGVTRDRLYADTEAFGRPYVLIDTGGFDPSSEDPMAQSIAGQIRKALSEADIVICLMDGSVDPLPGDSEAIALLRKSDKPVLYAVNKIDNPARALGAKQYYRLGLPRVFEVSALHGFGLGELEEALCEHLPEPATPSTQATTERPDALPGAAAEAPVPADPKAEREAESDELIPRVAIVGRPNAGKSSLVNRLLGEERQLVDARPGTTVDAVDTLYASEQGPMVLIDTAGMRRKRSVERGIEGLAVLSATRAIERADTVVLMIDAERGPAEQDTKIAGLALERGCAFVIALNKVDLLDADQRKQAGAQARDVLSFLPWAPLVRISAKTGRGVRSLMATVREVTQNHKRRAKTAEVNRFFEEVLARHPPPTSGGRPVRLYFITQARIAPPTFVVSTNQPARIHFSYKRYVENQLRERFGLHGTPIRIFYRGKTRKGG